MAQGFFTKNWLEKLMLPNGVVIEIKRYSEWQQFLKMFPDCIFSQHYKLFRNQIGVYRFNVNDKTHYIGYSGNLFNRVPVSFFNHCLTHKYVTFQYILCDSVEEAKLIERYYINTLKPTNNVMDRKIKPELKTIPEFCGEIYLHFNDYWETRQ